jgi:predicted deacetylase
LGNRFHIRTTLAAQGFAARGFAAREFAAPAWRRHADVWARGRRAIAIAVDLHRRACRPTEALATIAALSVLGLLSHGAALFALPILAMLLWRARRGLR